ncbi:MAG: dihydrolipoyl dehydrogenase [Anaerolineaceae bacterium]|nr:dihydrolipoyl dehydrogenase [Anaerolineaceae bacterium]MDD4042689.1 dihydrolipoyl dehydrogenase [Anaerolineaceae bacterium]MDD4577779.1 dihydrolipoyl dehydrogenase [Anaerolineaceae bacterium]
MKQFDVVVIGAGPGGYVAAIRASQLGLKTAIIDKQWLGGVCLNEGCIPSKALLHNAEIAHTLRNYAKDYGISFDNLELDYSAAFKRSRQVSQRLTKGVAFLMKKNNIEVIEGTASLLAAGKVKVELKAGGEEEIEAKDIILSTGAHATVVPGMEPDGEKMLDYSHAIMLEKLPKSAVIIGGGAIGVEFATIWNGYGVEVTIVEMLPHILPNEDEEAAAELAKAFRKRGVKVMADTKVKSVTKTDTGTTVVVEGEKGEESLEAEITLVAIGFKPNSQGIGLEEAGVALDKRGFVQINDRMATNVPGIWAVGDVTGKLLLAHTASAQGQICAENIARMEERKLDYRMIPRAVFSDPQVASFGYTEAQAKEAGFDVKVGRFNFIANGKALGLGKGTGFAKVITDAKYGEILGATLVGPEVSELLPELVLAQANELTVEEIAKSVHIHPTLSETVMEAAEAALGQGIHS